MKYKVTLWYKGKTYRFDVKLRGTATIEVEANTEVEAERQALDALEERIEWEEIEDIKIERVQSGREE